MKYFLIELSEIGGKIEKGVYEYATKREAMASYHGKMSGAMKNDNYESESVIIVDSSNVIVEKDQYVRLADPKVQS